MASLRSTVSTSLNSEAGGRLTTGLGGVVVNFLQVWHLSWIASTILLVILSSQFTFFSSFTMVSFLG